MTHTCNATTWRFKCRGFLRWLDAYCDCCHTGSMPGCLTPDSEFVHCGKREKCDDPVVLAAWKIWEPPSLRDTSQDDKYRVRVIPRPSFL